MVARQSRVVISPPVSLGNDISTYNFIQIALNRINIFFVLLPKFRIIYRLWLFTCLHLLTKVRYPVSMTSLDFVQTIYKRLIA